MNAAYPEPDIPAAEGWRAMQQLLVNQSPDEQSTTLYHKKRSQRTGLLLVLVLWVLIILSWHGNIQRTPITAGNSKDVPYILPDNIYGRSCGCLVADILNEHVPHINIIPADNRLQENQAGNNQLTLNTFRKKNTQPIAAMDSGAVLPFIVSENATTGTITSYQRSRKPSVHKLRLPAKPDPALTAFNFAEQRNTDIITDNGLLNKSIDKYVIEEINHLPEITGLPHNYKSIFSTGNGLLQQVPGSLKQTVNNTDTAAQKLLTQQVPCITTFTSAKIPVAMVKTNRSSFSFSLQWNMPVFNSSTGKYFTGSDGKTKPLTILLPELWLKQQFGKKLNQGIQLGINPFQQNTNGEWNALLVQGPLSPLNPVLVLRVTRAVKTVGPGITFQYLHSISSHWSGAAGFNYFFPVKALTKEDTYIIGSNDLLSTKFSGSKAGSQDSIWTYIKNKPLTFSFALSFQVKKWQFGTALLLPPDRLKKADINRNTPHMSWQLFIRRKIK